MKNVQGTFELDSIIQQDDMMIEFLYHIWKLCLIV